MLKQKVHLQNLYSKQDVLNIRFQYFVLKHSLNKPLLLSMNGEYPNYALIRMIHLLHLSDLLFNNDRNGIALYIEQLIHRSKNVENIIEKMVLISMLFQSFMILNQLDNQEASSDITLSKLLPEQISLRSSLALEFANSSVYWDQMNSNIEGMGLFDQVDENNDIVEVKPIKKYFLKGLSKFLFLKNMTKNQEAQYYQSIIGITELRNQGYKKALREKAFVEEFKLKSIRNMVGQKLTFIASPSWLHYSVRMHLINQKIQIFNVLSSNRQFDLNQLNQNQDGYEYYRTETELCIKSPDSNQDEEQWKKYKSCLRI